MCVYIYVHTHIITIIYIYTYVYIYIYTRMAIKWVSAPKSPSGAMTFQALQHGRKTDAVKAINLKAQRCCLRFFPLRIAILGYYL